MATDKKRKINQAKGKGLDPKGTPDREGSSVRKDSLQIFSGRQRSSSPRPDSKLKEASDNQMPMTPEKAPPPPRFPGEVISYGQQLQYERKLRGLSPIQLAMELGTTVPEVLKWENDQTNPELASRQKLSQILGNDFYLSSEVITNGTLQVRIVQRLLTAQDFTTIISVLTEFHTQFRLIQQGRFAHLAEYGETQDSRFEKEANLVIEGLSSNSPALITLITDPHIATAAVTTTVTLAVALQKAVNAIAQTWKKIQDIDQEHRKKKFEMEQEQSRAQIETKQKQFEIEQERWEKQLTRKQKEIESAIAMMVKIADTLYPGADEQTRATIMQALTPGCWKLLDRE